MYFEDLNVDEIKKMREDYLDMEQKLAETLEVLQRAEQQRGDLKTQNNAKDKAIKDFRADTALIVEGNAQMITEIQKVGDHIKDDARVEERAKLAEQIAACGAKAAELSDTAGKKTSEKSQGDKDLKARQLIHDQRKIIRAAIAIIEKACLTALREHKPLLGYDQLYDTICKQI